MEKENSSTQNNKVLKKYATEVQSEILPLLVSVIQ